MYFVNTSCNVQMHTQQAPDGDAVIEVSRAFRGRLGLFCAVESFYMHIMLWGYPKTIHNPMWASFTPPVPFKRTNI